NELPNIWYRTQTSGSCTFYSILYPMLYFLRDYEDESMLTKFNKLEYLIAIYAMNKICTAGHFYKPEFHTLVTFIDYKIRFIKNKVGDNPLFVDLIKNLVNKRNEYVDTVYKNKDKAIFSEVYNEISKHNYKLSTF